MRVAYIVSEYPAVSHAFILREVLAMRALGTEVETFTVYPSGPEKLLTEVDRAEAKRTHSVLPLRPPRQAAAHVRALLTCPGRYFSALRVALSLTPGGARGVVRQLFYLAAAVEVWHLCRRRGISHVHAHLATAASDIALLTQCLGGPGWRWSMTMHSTAKSEAQAATLPAKLRRASVVVCASDAVRAHLMLSLEEKHWAKLVVVHLGVDTAVFRRSGERRAGGELQVLTVGRLVHLKAHTLLLEAFAGLVRDHGVQAGLTIVGDGPLRGSLERQARELGIAERVRFAGAVGQDEIRSRYAAAEVFCLPSLIEGIPVVLMEAMAMELAVVATRVMGVPELVEHGESGLLVSPGRADQLAAALLELAERPQLRADLGSAGRRGVRAEFELEACARDLRETLASTAGARNRS